MYQILFLSGVMLTIGLKSTMQFFMKRQNYKVCPIHWASFYFYPCFCDDDISINWIGHYVLWFWLLSGPCGLANYGHDLGGLWVCRALQVWTIFSSGVLNFLFELNFPDHWYSLLHSGFWPTLAVFLQRIPILGWVFQQPFITSVRNHDTSCKIYFPHFFSRWLPICGLFSFAVLWSQQNQKSACLVISSWEEPHASQICCKIETLNTVVAAENDLLWWNDLFCLCNSDFSFSLPFSSNDHTFM